MSNAASVAITSFALRQWEQGKSGTVIEGITPQELVNICAESMATGNALIDGYAPFCKHLFITNTSPTRCSFAPITESNRRLLKCGYQSRREGELAVLERWFEGIKAPTANYLDIILYSYDQLLKEAAAFTEPQQIPDCDWGIVSIIGVLEPKEPPMPPITQMRNALGTTEGGSGVSIDMEKYTAAVTFWQHHAAIKLGS